MKLRLICVLATSLLLVACDYCPRPGVVTWAPYHCKPKPLAYPIPDMSPCPPAEFANAPVPQP